MKTNSDKMLQAIQDMRVRTDNLINEIVLSIKETNGEMIEIESNENCKLRRVNMFNSKKENADVIVCPHCEYVHGNYDDYIEVGDMDGDFEMECLKCKKNMSVNFYSVFWFTAVKS